jgi:hypothetical protein
MNEQEKYPTILPENLERTEIGPLEDDARPIDPVFLEWWKNNWWSPDCTYCPLEPDQVQAVALSAWQAHDAKIARLEADFEHFRLSSLPAEKEDLLKKGAKALNVAVEWGGLKQAKHKAWVIDQMVRALTGSNYDALVARARSGEKGPETYAWDCGVEP